MSDSITANAGFFWDNEVSPDTATDLLTAVEEANANLDGAITAETNANASATAAAASALSAAGAQSAAATSETNAATSASTATTQAAAAASSATAAASSASSAAADVTAAASSASAAAGSATTAASSATAAANSATNAATSATNAAASATTASNAAATIPAPGGHANQYLRVNGSGNAYEQRTPASVASDIGALNDVGRNKLHNPMFNIAQRGAGPWSATTNYTADRWQLAVLSDTAGIAVVGLSGSDRTAIGDEEAIQALQNTFTGTSGAGAFNCISQKIENVLRLSNKSVTISFWAKATSGTPKLGVSLDQVFGTGGSPSATVQGNGTSVTLSTSWARYSVAIAIPSAASKTLGTNGDHFTQMNLWFSSGSTNATRAGSVGVQSNIVALWGVQLEIGFIMTQLEKPDIQADFANCERFYQTGTTFLAGWSGASSQQCAYYVPFPVTMRGVPTVALSGGSLANIASLTAAQISTSGFVANGSATASGTFSFNSPFTATADL